MAGVRERRLPDRRTRSRYPAHARQSGRPPRRLSPGGDNIAHNFDVLLRAVAKTHPAGRVAVLVDEYDKPIIDYLEDLPKAEANRDVLKTFYSVLKNAGGLIEVVFITGVSASSTAGPLPHCLDKVSLISDLNNLRLLTFYPLAHTLCGMT